MLGARDGDRGGSGAQPGPVQALWLASGCIAPGGVQLVHGPGPAVWRVRCRLGGTAWHGVHGARYAKAQGRACAAGCERSASNAGATAAWGHCTGQLARARPGHRGPVIWLARRVRNDDCLMIDDCRSAPVHSTPAHCTRFSASAAAGRRRGPCMGGGGAPSAPQQDQQAAPGAGGGQHVHTRLGGRRH